MRHEKLSDALVREISGILHTRVKDPRIGFITITDAEVTKDLRIAKVYYSVLGSEREQTDTIRALESAKTFIQSEIGSRIRLKFLPMLIFKLDKSMEYGARIDALIEQLHAGDAHHSE